MEEAPYLLSVGVNTGNSLDAADAVLTKFGADGSIEDLYALSAPMPAELANRLRHFRKVVVECDGDVIAAAPVYSQSASTAGVGADTLEKLIADYTLYVAKAVSELVVSAKDKFGADIQVDLIGFHGQTCAHQPSSIAKNADDTYTLQLGDGQLLADETGITVAYDFRSDDLMNGGEAAPLAPMHHRHLARHLKNVGKFPIAFGNAGNTGNISVITEKPDGSVTVIGWDVGPFNDYPDKLVQAEKAEGCDLDGKYGSQGKINVELLRLLFENGAVTDHGANFLLQPPPKSSDPQWYRILPELSGAAPVDGVVLSFEDRIRTAEYFAAYVYYYSLKWIPADLKIPNYFALCGGGWNNPISRSSFEHLVRGEFDKVPILPEHAELFNQIRERMHANKTGPAEVAMSDEFGFSGQFMEARLFGDLAVCRITGEPFTRPETSGCKTPTVLGILRFAQKKEELASHRLKTWLQKYSSRNLTVDDTSVFDGRWSRGARGWNAQRKLVAKI